MPWSVALLMFSAGLLLGAVVARVMYRREHTRAQRAEEKARQSAKLAELGAMTAGLAHEIKNPLSTIGLNAQLLGEAINELPIEPDSRPRLVNRVGALRRETDRLRGILQDFLEYAGQIRLDKRPTNIADLSGELVDFLLPEAERSGVRLRLDVPGAGETTTASVDVRLMKQVLLNLMLNAIHAVRGKVQQATGDQHSQQTIKGEVIVRVRELKRSAKSQADIEIHVIDTGPGIAPENLEKVFQPYFTTKSGGTGLGLPTARRYVEEHGGTLSVQSTPGLGTDFTISLPIENQHAR